MEPLLIILVPGVAGGILLAFLLARWPARAALAVPPPRRSLAPTSPSLINMARIQIDGVGGLGMVAMALVVAISVPWIRLSVSLGLLLGVAAAAALIAWRRAGPLASSSRHAGAHSDSWAWEGERERVRLRKWPRPRISRTEQRSQRR
jgi:hypothetical protein